MSAARGRADVMQRHWLIRLLAVVAIGGVMATPLRAQGRVFAGVLAGVSTLSADARSVVSGSEVQVSLYKPENGAAVNVFAGYRLAEFFAVQANWIWNDNDLRLLSSVASPAGSAFYEQPRRSHQHVFDIDGLIYFRRSDSLLRPYLGTGFAIMRFTSEAEGTPTGELQPPGKVLRSTKFGLRSHVGIDVSLATHLAFRYSFSETITRNPISPSLMPPAERRLANFQNLFGLLYKF